jgi:hypothetical protein
MRTGNDVRRVKEIMYDFYDDYPKVSKHEFRLNGQTIPFDVCSSSSLGKAKAFYTNYDYIGSSNVMLLDGREVMTNNEYHFFKRK